MLLRTAHVAGFGSVQFRAASTGQSAKLLQCAVSPSVIKSSVKSTGSGASQRKASPRTPSASKSPGRKSAADTGAKTKAAIPSNAAVAKKENAKTAPGTARVAAPGRKSVAGATMAKAGAGKSARSGRPAKRLPRPRIDRETVSQIFHRFASADPEPTGELDHSNPFTLLVAVVLSAQATDAGVNRATKHLFQIADTPEKMLQLGEDAVREEIRTIGLFRNKAKNVIALSQVLVDHHGGQVPCDREILESLPGVGRKTANVVLNIAFRQPTIAVDTHLFRVSNRLGMAPGKTPLEVELGLLRTIPEEFLLHAHHWLILHGRYVCVARKPKCAKCVIADLCNSKEKTL